MAEGRIVTTTVSETDEDIAPTALPTSESLFIITCVPKVSPTHGMYELTEAPIPMIGFDTLIEQEYSPASPDIALDSRSVPADPSLEEPHSSDMSSCISSVHSLALMSSLHLAMNASVSMPVPLARYDATSAEASQSYSR